AHTRSASRSVEGVTANAQGYPAITEFFMRSGLVASLIRWTVAVALLSGLLALAYAFRGILGERRGPEAAVQESRLAGNNVVKLGKELAESYGLKEDAAQAVE